MATGRIVGQVKSPAFIAMTWGGIFVAGLIAFSAAKMDIYRRKVNVLQAQRDTAAAQRQADKAAAVSAAGSSTTNQ